MAEPVVPDPWRIPEGVPSLGFGEIHVWRAYLPGLGDALNGFDPVLIPAEIERADRFRFPGDRARYATAQGLIRLLLGAYLDTAPESVPLVYGPRGKPALGPGLGRDLRFNVSHAQDLVLLALSEGIEVGVDVEHIRPQRAGEGLVRRFFSPREGEQWFAYPPSERVIAFFRCWTRKEAYIKAKGEGMWLPLERFTVSLGAPALLEAEWDPAEPGRWTMFDLAPGEEYAGALVAEGTPRRVRRWDWTRRTAHDRSPDRERD